MAVYAGDNDFNYVMGGAEADTLYGFDGNDLLEGMAGADVLDGGGGRDAASYRMSTHVHVALDFSFAATGEAVGDTFVSIEDVEGSLTGDDMLSGNGHANRLFGFGGNDRLYGRAGNDQLYGADGADTLTGGSGNDTLTGGDAADRLYGNDGNDRLDGGDGKDVLSGGAGRDVFVFSKISYCGDRISDFRAEDGLQFEHTAFRNTHVGVLAATAFWVNTSGKAHDATDRFIYDRDDHTLYFDSNGSVAGGVVKVAVLQPGAVVTASDILIA